MPLYVPAILIPALVLSAYLSLKALNELEKGSDTFNVIVLGFLAGDQYFTPKGRRYRMWSLSILGGGVLVIALIYVLTAIE